MRAMQRWDEEKLWTCGKDQAQCSDKRKKRQGEANVNLEDKEAKFHGSAVDHGKADSMRLHSAPKSEDRRPQQTQTKQVLTSFNALPENTTPSPARCAEGTKVERLRAPISLLSMPARMASIHDTMSGSLRRAMTSLGHALTPVECAVTALGASTRMQNSKPSRTFLVRLTLAVLSNATMPLAADGDKSSETHRSGTIETAGNMHHILTTILTKYQSTTHLCS